MSRTSQPSSAVSRRRALPGALLALLAWLALLVAPIAAQAMTRIDAGVPGAIICSVNKAASKEGGKAVVQHCQLCTLAQQSVDTPVAVPDLVLTIGVVGVVGLPAVTPTPRFDSSPRPPPRAPPLP